MMSMLSLALAEPCSSVPTPALEPSGPVRIAKVKVCRGQYICSLFDLLCKSIELVHQRCQGRFLRQIAEILPASFGNYLDCHFDILGVQRGVKPSVVGNEFPNNGLPTQSAKHVSMLQHSLE